MKKHFLIKFLIGTIFLFIFSLPCHAVGIGFEPVSQMPGVGESVSVDIVISGLGDFAEPSLGFFDVDISYDTSILTFGGYELGPYLGDIFLGEAIDTSFGEIVPGEINISELSFLEANDNSGPFFIPPYLDEIQPGSFALATLTFDSIAVGTSPLIIAEAILSDAFGDPLQPEIRDGSISPVPEPATILLLASGMAGLGVFGRKKFRK